MRVLFSPIGGTDTVSGCYDGPMLHIVRHYRPDIICLYLSAEMAVHHRETDNYRLHIRHVVPDAQIDVMETGLTDVHQFNLFPEPFREMIDQYHDQYPKAEILLNIASGTPQMQAALCLIASTAGYPILPIQVSSPAKAQNKSKGERKNYDFKDELATLIDEPANGAPESDRPNRCSVACIQNFVHTYLSARLKALIGRYDYAAARVMLNGNEGLFHTNLVEGLSYADKKWKMDLRHVPDLFRPMFLPVFDDPNRSILEYFFIFEAKIQKDELEDGLLMLTPLMTEAAQRMIEKYDARLLKDHTCYNDIGSLCWDIEKALQHPLLVRIASQYEPRRQQEVTFHHLVELFTSLDIKSPEYDRQCEDLLYLQDVLKLRNNIAHRIERYTADDFASMLVKLNQRKPEWQRKQWSGINNPLALVQVVQRTLAVFIDKKHLQWTYGKMNDWLEQQLPLEP